MDIDASSWSGDYVRHPRLVYMKFVWPPLTTMLDERPSVLMVWMPPIAATRSAER